MKKATTPKKTTKTKTKNPTPGQSTQKKQGDKNMPLLVQRGAAIQESSTSEKRRFHSGQMAWNGHAKSYSCTTGSLGRNREYWPRLDFLFRQKGVFHTTNFSITSAPAFLIYISPEIILREVSCEARSYEGSGTVRRIIYPIRPNNTQSGLRQKYLFF